jgi:hypothetical protein
MEKFEDGWGSDNDISIEDGWGDDELDILDNDDDEMAALNHQEVVSTPSALAVDDGWDWNESADNSGAADPCVSTIHNESKTDPFVDIAEQKLISYINDLSNPLLLHRLNDQLATERNNTESALQLCHYFHERKNLLKYTLESEVPRMDYQIMISDEHILTKATEIQQYFVHNPVDNLVDDMLLRSSNQSLLADIFLIITGPDGIVRMQYHANAVATKCRLVLDMREARSSQVDCSLIVSIPSGRSPPHTKLDLAELRVMIQFSPEPAAPYVNYQLLSLKPLIDVDAQKDTIRSASGALDPHQMEIMEDEVLPSITDNLRDNFLDSVMSTQTATGFKSALKEIDGIVNVSRKLKMLKQHLVLPSGNDIIYAEEETRGIGEDRIVKKGTVQHDLGIQKEMPAPTGRYPVSPLSTRQDPSAPKPIIGGLLMSGITRLAKAAAIPEEDDTPVLYRRQNIPPPLIPHQNRGGNKQQICPPPPAPKFYTNKPNQVKGQLDTESNIQLSSKSYNKEVAHIAITDAQTNNLSDGGWSNGDLEDLDDDPSPKGDTASLLHEKSPPPPNPRTEMIPTVHNASLDDHALEPLSTTVPNQGIQSFNAPPPRTTQVVDSLGLTPELRVERDYLVRKLDEIAEVKSHFLKYNQGGNEGAEQAATRKRFVSRAEILGYRESV